MARGIAVILTFYLLTLLLAAGSTGVYLQQVLAAQGYVPTLASRLALAGGVTAAYLALQFLYLFVIRVLKPTGSRTFYLCESLSQAAALLLLPGLLHWSIPWPDPMIAKVEPLVFLGGFAALHLLLKLMSFYAALTGEPGSRTPALAWLLLCMAALGGGYVGLNQWFGLVQQGHLATEVESGPQAAGGVYAKGRSLRESASCEIPLEASATDGVRMLWAYPADYRPAKPNEQVYVYVQFLGEKSQGQWQPVALTAGGWSEFRIAPGRIPPGTKRCRVAWRAEKPSPWEKLSGVPPLQTSERQLICAGPWPFTPRKESRPLNYVIVAIDGLSSRHLSALGYPRATTPGLDALAAAGLFFPAAYTSAPETAAGCMTILTGASPLRHRYLGASAGPLPPGIAPVTEILRGKGYATAAFVETEGEENAGVTYGSGFERGFMTYDTAYTSDKEAVQTGAAGADEQAPQQAQTQLAGSADTLARAKTWIAEHIDVPFLVFIRLRELGDMRLRERNGAEFIDPAKKNMPLDEYDSLLVYLDRHIGAFTKHLREYDTRRNTCIVVTAPYGYDFTGPPGAPPERGLFEDSLQVPLLLWAPGLTRSEPETAPVSLQDALPTALGLSSIVLPSASSVGFDLRAQKRGSGAISMSGDPLILSLRDANWRLYWSAGITPFAAGSPNLSGPTQLYRAPRGRGGTWSGDVAAANQQTVARLRGLLADELRNSTLR